jgi:hypothetical protein
MKYEIARKMLIAKQADTMQSDLSQWTTNDPLFQTAVAQAKSVTKGAKLDDVLTAYIGDSMGADARTKALGFKQIVTSQAMRNKDSQFGMVDYRSINNNIDAQLISKFSGGLLQRIGKAFNTMSPAAQEAQARDAAAVKEGRKFFLGDTGE